MTALNKQNMLVTSYTAKGEEHRAIGSMLVEPDGTTVGCDGKTMAIVSPQQLPPEVIEDETKTEIHTPEKAELVPLEEALDMRREVSRGNGSEYNSEGVLVRVPAAENRVAYERITKKNRRRFETWRREEKPFAWRDVLPDVESGYAEIGVDARYLARAAATVIKFHGNAGRLGMKLCRLYVPKKDPAAPVVIKARNIETEQDLTVIVMPLRL